MNKDLATTENKPTWKGNKKQRLFIEYWCNPQSETFGNVTKSGLKAGFSRSYSMNLTHLAPQWLSENIEKLNLYEEHIKQGIYDIALNTDNTNSKSPNDTKLRAYEVLSEIHGITGKNKGVTNNILVQPILNGSSVNPEQLDEITAVKPHSRDTHIIEAELIPD